MGRITDLVRREMQRPVDKSSSPELLELCDFIRRNRGDEVIEELFHFMKVDQAPMLQLRAFMALTECTSFSGPEFIVCLSQEKYLEKVLKVAKESKDAETRDAVMRQIFKWTVVYKMTGMRAIHDKLSNTKGNMGVRYKQIIEEEKKKMVSVMTVGGRVGVGGGRTRAIHSTLETFILSAEGDLAALEYALEHPEMLDEGNVDDCRHHASHAQQLIESQAENPLSPEIVANLKELLNQLNTAINLHDAIFGEDGNKAAAAVKEDEQQRTAQTGNSDKATSNAIAAGKLAIDELVEKERQENKNLLQKLEDLQNSKEELQGKYKNAKEKNKKLITLVEQYGQKLDEYEATGGVSTETSVARVQELEAKIAEFEKNQSKGKKTRKGAGGIDIDNINPELLRRIRNDIKSCRKSIRTLKGSSLNDLGKEISLQSVHIQGMVARIVEASANDRKSDAETIKRLQDLYKREVKLRKTYYNIIQELKGNIRVYSRVRPMTIQELQHGSHNVITTCNNEELYLTDDRGKKKYEFECVFGQESTQAEVFEDTAPLIDSVVDGYNVCIFAYGQTSSGKTYTMMGETTENLRGINRRAMDRLFQIIKEREGNETSTVTVSILEIYCEQIRDLLAPKSEVAKTSYEVKQGGPYGNYVINLKDILVNSSREIETILQKATANRSEGQTDMNTHSSRSHMLLYIIVRTQNSETGIQSYGKLSLIDLAGSERLDKSNATGQLQKEAISINKSLSALGDVIQGLSTQNKHIPFRNSTLTYLLQDSMQGQAKVLMFCCISPADYNVNESNCSLLFANRARGVALGPIKKNAAITS